MSETHALVDVEFAITQLGGNSDLLKRMLGKFSAEFDSVPKEVKRLLEVGEIKEAKMKVHTTKGLSGNLGMTALYECSKTLDKKLRDNDVDYDLVESFSVIMTKTCEFIDTIDLAEKEKTPFIESESTNSENVNELKDLFLKRLQGHEFIDDEALHEYVDQLPLSDTRKHELVSLVEELQYEKAIALIKSI